MYNKDAISVMILHIIYLIINVKIMVDRKNVVLSIMKAIKSDSVYSFVTIEIYKFHDIKYKSYRFIFVMMDFNFFF